MKIRSAPAKGVDSSFALLNRQRTRRIDPRQLRRIVDHFLKTELGTHEFDLAIHLIDMGEMTRLNETRLRHAGSTDVITFDYSVKEPVPILCGEIFVCVDEATIQAVQFRTTWQSELVRYIVHGVLHLMGHDDLKSAARLKMKTEENRVMRELSRDFDLRKAQGKTRLTA